jgi:acyl-coenzyme A synthetase/AMP-(fatty) acid ligase
MKWLVDNFLSYLENDAIVYNNKQYTYQNLYDQVLDFSQGFLKDVERGEVVAIVGDYSFNSIALMLALYENNNIVVPIAATVELEINDRAREAYCDKSINVETLKIERIKNSLNKHNMIDILQKKSESGLILFSSGSTGKPKAMVHSLDNLINSYQDKRVKKVNMLIFLMFDHIGGLNTMFNALSMGNNLVLPKDKSAEGVCSLIEEYKIKVLPSSPTFLNLILISGSHKKYNLSSIRMITYGTETMPESLLKRIKSEFPRVKLLQTFGTSETGIARTSSQSSDSTFMKIDDPNLEYKIVDNELWLKSNTQVLGYLNASMESFTDDGWFRTGDLVERSDDGFIKIVGRSKEVINIGGEKVLPVEVESVILSIKEIDDCMVYGEKNAITGQMVVVDVTTSIDIKRKEIKKIIRMFCRDKLDNYKIPTKVNLVDKTNFGDRFKKIRQKNVKL